MAGMGDVRLAEASHEPTQRDQALRRTRGTDRPSSGARLAPGDPGPPLLNSKQERWVTTYLGDHATMKPNEFEAKYRHPWLTAPVVDAGRMLALHRHHEQWREDEINKTHGTMDIDRQRQAEVHH